jgi:hypothetical protein
MDGCMDKYTNGWMDEWMGVTSGLRNCLARSKTWRKFTKSPIMALSSKKKFN